VLFVEVVAFEKLTAGVAVLAFVSWANRHLHSQNTQGTFIAYILISLPCHEVLHKGLLVMPLGIFATKQDSRFLFLGFRQSYSYSYCYLDFCVAVYN
jgi:hypothetical protein